MESDVNFLQLHPEPEQQNFDFFHVDVYPPDFRDWADGFVVDEPEIKFDENILDIGGTGGQHSVYSPFTVTVSKQA